MSIHEGLDEKERHLMGENDKNQTPEQTDATGSASSDESSKDIRDALSELKKINPPQPLKYKIISP